MFDIQLHIIKLHMRTFFALVVVVIATGCSQFEDAPAPSPVFPDTESVSRIANSSGIPITNPDEIREFMAALQLLNSGWSYTWHTYPTPSASIVLVDKSNQPVCRVDLGPNWLGSTCGHIKAGWPPYVKLSPEQALFFRDIVGGKWDVK